MTDLKSNLKNLDLVWDDATKSVYISEQTGLGLLEYKGKTYVDLRRIAFRYQNGGLPYSYDTKLGIIGRSENGMGITVVDDIGFINRYDGEINDHYPNSAYFEYDKIKEDLVTLLKVTYENEKYIKETPYEVTPID